MASTTNNSIVDVSGRLGTEATESSVFEMDTQAIEITASIPVPRRQAMAIMRAWIAAIGGNFIPICQPGDNAAIGFRSPADGLTVLGTGCRRPLLCEEAQDLRNQTGDHVLLVRIEDEAHGYGAFTVDLLLAHMDSWLIRYRLWQIHPTSDLWLVPSQGEGRSIRFVAGYLAVSPRAPFFNLYEREYGYAIAAQTLTAIQGEK